jgi:hypothetical protein
MSFSVTPITDLPPAVSDATRRSLQFQFNGVDVGGRETDTVNISDLSNILSVTAGVGEQVNVLTIGSVAAPAVGLGWNTTNESPEGGWTFAEGNYRGVRA